MTARTRSARTTAPIHGVAPPSSATLPYGSWLVALGLAALCALAYANAFGTGFALDSRQLILRDARVQALTRENLSLIFSHTYWWPIGESGLYRPLTTLSYLFNYAILGNHGQPAGYHWINFLLHAANVLLVYFLALRLLSGGGQVRGARFEAREKEAGLAPRTSDLEP